MAGRPHSFASKHRLHQRLTTWTPVVGRDSSSSSARSTAPRDEPLRGNSSGAALDPVDDEASLGGLNPPQRYASDIPLLPESPDCDENPLLALLALLALLLFVVSDDPSALLVSSRTR